MHNGKVMIPIRNASSERWQTILEKERHRFVLWFPVCVGLGISSYFAYQPDISAAMYALAIAGVAGMVIFAWYLQRGVALLLLSAVFAGVLGMGSASYRTERVSTPILQETIQYSVIEGLVGQILLKEKGVRVVIDHPVIAGLSVEDTPKKIRVSVRKALPQGLDIGDRVRFKATLYPLPRPALPGGFDFTRYFYYQSIGAVGFVIGDIAVTSAQEQAPFWQSIDAMRRGVAFHLRELLGAPVGDIATALIVGIRDTVPEESKQYMRDAGLAHVLAISGLHLSLVAGLIFFAIRLLLALSPALALRMNIKKMAAVGALVGAGLYLVLAGYPISAQRAFIMVGFVLCAVLIDRRGISVYSLAWAATIILLLQPESWFSAGFQMSFAATLAIVALYEHFREDAHVRGSIQRSRLVKHVGAILLTTLAANIATMPFVITHFNRVPVWSLIANIATMPLIGFWIMPAAMIGLLLWLVFGLDIGFVVMGWGIEVMYTLAENIAQLPAASLLVYTLTDVGFALAILGLLWLCLWRSSIRYLGVIGLIAGIATAAFYHTPDILVSDDGRQVMVAIPGKGYTMAKGAGHSFTAENWLAALAEDQALKGSELTEDDRRILECDKIMCTYRRAGKDIVIVKKIDALNEACNRHPYMLIVWWYTNAKRCAENTFYIERDALERGGAHQIFIDEETGDFTIQSTRHQPYILHSGE